MRDAQQIIPALKGKNMIDKTFAEHFAQEWIDVWNSHDLNRILSH
jgi:hypothetical protein